MLLGKSCMIGAVHEPINEWEPATVNNELGEGEAHVWRASLDQPADVIAKFAPLLSHDEYQRAERFHRVLAQFFEGRQIEPISTSPYVASAASHTGRIMALGPMISDVSNCPFLILFANSIPLSVTSAFPNALNPSIG